MLLTSVRKADLENVKLAITMGEDVNLRDPHSGDTALILACEGMQLPIVQFLLEVGADPNLPDDRGNSPLMIGIANPTLSDTAQRVCMALLENGAQLDHRNQDGESAIDLAFFSPKPSAVSSLLMVLLEHSKAQLAEAQLIEWGFKAVQFQQPEALKWLIQQGLPPDTQNKFGNSLLVEACRMHKHDAILVLLNAGSTFDFEPQLGWNKHVLSTACYLGLWEVLEFLSQKDFLRQANPVLVQTAINHAVSNDQWEVISFLEDRGMDILEYRPGTKPTLHTVIQYGAYGTFKPWAKKIKDWNIMDAEGNTPLHYAAFYDRMAFAKDALRNGANVNALNHKGWNALMQCAATGSERIARLLLENHSELNQPCMVSGVTALFVAASEGRQNLVKILLQAGADPHLLAHNGKIARTEAVANGHKEIAELLGPEIPHFTPHLSDSGSPHCAYCATPLTDDSVQHNYCTVCKAFYCETHFEWGRWHRPDPTEIYPSRKGSCPNGHIKWEY